MSVLSWGMGVMEWSKSTGGKPGSSWQAFDIPKDGTINLTTTAGTETTALEEGGTLVDVRYAKNTYQLEFDLFVKKGVDAPFEDNDGVISGEYAIRYTPEDEECEGFQIDRSIIRVEDSFTTADGKMRHYVVRCLKPASGKTVKPYTKSVSD